MPKILLREFGRSLGSDPIWSGKKVSHFCDLWFLLTNSNNFFSPLQSEIIHKHKAITSLPHNHVKCDHVQFCKNLHCSTHNLMNKNDVTEICYWLLLILMPMYSLLPDEINWRALWKNRTSWYISFFSPSLNGVLFPMFCLLVERKCQILVF